MPQTPTQLMPDLWVAQSATLRLNSGVFVSSGRACLVDPALLPEEVLVVGGIAAQQGAEMETVLLTHSHWDHVLGPQHFPGVEVVAHERFPEETAKASDGILMAVAELEEEAGVGRDRPFAVPEPDRTFSGEVTIAVGDLELQLIEAPGHAADQFAVYEPERRTLWAADTLSDLEIPYVIHSLTAYKRTLDRLAALDVRVLVPGHGNPTTDPAEVRRRLDRDRTYLSEVYHRVLACVRKGEPVERSVAACADVALHRPGQEGPHRYNVEAAYVELGGDANPEEIGWIGAWKRSLE